MPAHKEDCLMIHVSSTIVLDDKGTADPADDVTCSGKIWYVFDN